MRSRLVWGVCAALLACGCANRSDNDEQCTSHVSTRPSVALVPLMDNTIHDLPWSLSDELTSAVQHRLLVKERLRLFDAQKIRAITKKLNASHDPFGPNIAWVKKAFPENEFVVFMELIEHQEVAVPEKESSAELRMVVRLRVLDLRGEQPQIVLQELVQNSHFLPMQFTKTYFHQVPWGKDNFNISPLGLAHTQLSKEIAGRLEDYILLAKSR